MHAPTKTRETLNDRLLLAGLVVIGAILLTMMGGLWRYKNTPGSPAMAPSTWPRAAGLPLHDDGLTLLMFAHPMCACTRASLNELRELMGPGRIHAMVLFAMPEGLVEDWSGGAAWELAASIPGVAALPDPGEHEARLFGAATSGQVVVYDAQGRLVFSGGITGARGHVGDNDGRRRIAALAAGAQSELSATPVFGCPLDDAPVAK